MSLSLKKQQDLKLVNRALGGDRAAMETLVRRLQVVIEARARRVLGRQATRARVEEAAQEIFEVLCKDDFKTLRRWNPMLGLSLENYVGNIAVYRTISNLKRGKFGKSEEEPHDDMAPFIPPSQHGPEEAVATREIMERALDDFRADFSPLGQEVFDALFVEELTVSDTAARLGRKPNAISNWKKRIRVWFDEKLSVLMWDSAGEE